MSDERQEDLEVLVGLPDISPEERAARIAEVLRSGRASAKFLNSLAFRFAPPPHKKLAWQAIIKPLKKGRPRVSNAHIGAELADAIDTRGDKYEAAIADAMARHRKSKSVCEKALQEERERRDLVHWMETWPEAPKN